MNSNGKHEELNENQTEAAHEAATEQEIIDQTIEETPEDTVESNDDSELEALPEDQKQEDQKQATEDEELEGSQEIQEQIEEGLGMLQEKKRKWIPFVFEEPLPQMEPFDLHPVNDVVVRNAVNDGVRNKRDLSLYKTTAEWNNYPPGTVIITHLVEVGQPFAVWDPPRRKKRKSKKDQDTTDTADMTNDDASEEIQDDAPEQASDTAEDVEE